MERVRVTVLSADKTQQCEVEIDFEAGYITGRFSDVPELDESKEVEDHGN